MDIVREREAINVNAGVGVVIKEFPMEEVGISGALANIDGRYPETGFAKNMKSKELVYVVEGEGKIILTKMEHAIKIGDVLLINEEELFAWEGRLKLFMATAPKFNPDQHEIVEENYD